MKAVIFYLKIIILNNSYCASFGIGETNHARVVFRIPLNYVCCYN